MFSSNRLLVSVKSRGTAALSCILLVVLGAPLWGQSLGRLVVVGDSLSAGFQNFSLYDSDSAPGIPAGGQKHGYAALIAQQSGANLNLPLLSFPGLPPVLTIDASGNITRGTNIGARENPLVQTLDLSVPGYTVADALARSINITNVTNPIDGMALQVLGFPGLATQSPPCGALGFQNGILTLSEVACALQLQPTTILVSIGNNDALQSLTLGAPPTPAAQFAVSYGVLVGALANTGAKIIVSNIPDVTSVPFLVPAPAFQASCHFLPAGVTAADFLVPNLVDQTQSSFNICSSYALRSASLIAQAQSAVVAYNATIAQVCQHFGAIVVDVNGVLRQISQSGYVVGGRRLTAGFLGGIFSLDGIHPTNTGYAILANAVIRRMNTQLDTNIPLISVESVAKTDPLVF
jgi:lysophospholipase L1-like esterase